MTDTPFREALKKAYIAGDGGQLESIMLAEIDEMASNYPPEDHARELLEALEMLYDEQNGPSLLSREDEWNEAMEATRKVLVAIRGKLDGSVEGK